MTSIPGRRFCGIAGTRHRHSVAALLFVIVPYRGWNYIRCPDRCLGWIDEETFIAVDAAAVTAWSSADLYRVVRQNELLRSEPGADAAPDYDEWHARGFVRARRFVAQ